MPASRQRWPKTSAVYWADSIGPRNSVFVRWGLATSPRRSTRNGAREERGKKEEIPLAALVRTCPRKRVRSTPASPMSVRHGRADAERVVDRLRRDEPRLDQLVLVGHPRADVGRRELGGTARPERGLEAPLAVVSVVGERARAEEGPPPTQPGVEVGREVVAADAHLAALDRADEPATTRARRGAAGEAAPRARGAVRAAVLEEVAGALLGLVGVDALVRPARGPLRTAVPSARDRSNSRASSSSAKRLDRGAPPSPSAPAMRPDLDARSCGLPASVSGNLRVPTDVPMFSRPDSMFPRAPEEYRRLRRRNPAGAGLLPCARVDSNHHGPYGPQGPQPCASTNSATGARPAEYRPARTVVASVRRPPYHRTHVR